MNKETLLVFLLKTGMHLTIKTSKDEARRVIESMSKGECPPILGHGSVKSSDPEYWHLQADMIVLAHTADAMAMAGQMAGQMPGQAGTPPHMRYASGR